MKAGWTSKSLEDACTFINGLWKGEKDPLKTVGVIRNTNFTKDGTLDDTDIAFIEVEVKKFDKRKLFAGDIILEKSGGGPKQAVGRVVLFDKSEGDYSFSNFTAAIRVKSPDELDANYLHKFLHWTYLSGVTEGMQSNSTGIRNLDGDKYKAIQVSYPSIAKQRRIVTLLDEAFANIATAKANAEKNLQNARDLYRAFAAQIFSAHAKDWSAQTLDELAVNLDCKRVPITKSDRKPGEYPYYGASGIVDYVDGYIFEGDTLLISEDGANLLARSTPIAFPASGRYWVNNHAHILQFNSMSTQKFVELYLESIPLDGYITGAAQLKLNQKALNSIPIPIPDSTVDQQLIVDQLVAMQDQCEQLASAQKQKLTALDDLKKSLLHQAFSGQL